MRSRKPLPRRLRDAFARALFTTGERLAPVLQPTGIRFNQYIRTLDSGQLEVWVLPAWQTDGRLVFGSEYRLVLDKNGQDILRESIPEPQLSDMRPVAEDTWLLPNDDAGLPSVGQLFSLLLVRDHVALAGIRNRDYTTTYIDGAGSGKAAWVNVSNERDLASSVLAMRKQLLKN